MCTLIDFKYAQIHKHKICGYKVHVSNDFLTKKTNKMQHWEERKQQNKSEYSTKQKSRVYKQTKICVALFLIKMIKKNGFSPNEIQWRTTPLCDDVVVLNIIYLFVCLLVLFALAVSSSNFYRNLIPCRVSTCMHIHYVGSNANSKCQMTFHIAWNGSSSSGAHVFASTKIKNKE